MTTWQTAKAIRKAIAFAIWLYACLLALVGIDLENIVYYKDDTHYFVMTAKKQSLLEKGVILHVSEQSPDLSAMWCVWRTIVECHFVSVVDVKALLYAHTHWRNHKPLPVFLSVSVFLFPNGLTKPKMFRNRLSTQAHLLFVSSLWQQFPFPGHFPQETGKAFLHVCLHVQA